MTPMLLSALAFSLLAQISRAALPPSGHVAAWLYDTKGGASAEWSAALAGFNAKAKHPINVAFSYGGDMEYYPPPTGPQTYFPADAAAAAATYRSGTAGVEYVVAVIDGRMDGGQPYSPDLSRRTQAEVEAWADKTASLLCSHDQVDGVQMDLEPFAAPYLPRLLQFLARLSANLRSRERGCADDGHHPTGRSLSAFMFAAAATPEVWRALGPNGYVTVSGYDLAPAPAGTPSTPAAYRAQLDEVLATIAPLADANNGSFVVGIPAAASCHEFERYSFANGTVVQGHPQQQYLEAALQAISDAKLHSNARFLGTALWGFASKMAYPPQSDNTFTPGTPFVDKGEEDFLQTYTWGARGADSNAQGNT